MNFYLFKYKQVFNLLILLVALLGFQTVEAQQISFRASAPKVVSIGEQFQLAYSVNAQGTNIRPGNLASFTVISGPNASQSTNVQIVGGKMEKSFNVTYTYILQSQKAGLFNIAPGKIIVEGKEYTSNALKIEVVKTKSSSQGNSGNGRTNSADGIASNDLYLRMFISDREVLKGEPVVATLKLFTRVGLANLGGFKAPDFNGFWSEVLREAQNLNFQKENIDGQVYNTAVIQQHVLIPERTGELTIGPSELTAIAQVKVQNQRNSRSLFNQVFGRVQNVEKLLSSPTIKVKVNPLPTGAPAGYEGAVGAINLTASLDPKETKTNEAIALKVSFKGSGNLKLLSEPKIKFPSDFEVYDPKIGNNYSTGANGYSGSKTFEYLVIPRHVGDYEIPAFQFSVFDLGSKEYKRHTAGPFQIHVEKGDGNSLTAIDLGTMKEDVQVLGADIHYIQTNDFELRQKDRPFFGSALFYSTYGLSLGLFAFAFIGLRKQRRQSEDVVFMKNKKAGRAAQTRLKQAKTFLDQNERTSFYKEILNALWTYLSDKLNIGQSKLKKDVIRENLTAKNIEEPLQKELFDLMNRCEYAQFAPDGKEGALTGVYEEAARLIEGLEKGFTKKN